MSIERNAEICRLYTEGITIADCAERFTLSRMRVRQILKKAGVYRPHVRGDRDIFLGVYVSDEDKIALRAEAARRGVSMSALTSDIIKDMLAARIQEIRS